MDDVVADWKSHAEEILGHVIEPGGIRVPDDEWAKLKKDQRFYRYLPIKKGGDELVTWVYRYCQNHTDTTMGFLTAIPHDNDMIWASYDKVMWANQNFRGIPVFFGPYSHDKYKHAEPGDILIDDRISNIKEWIDAGGIGHLYRDWPTCKNWLEQTLDARY